MTSSNISWTLVSLLEVVPEEQLWLQRIAIISSLATCRDFSSMRDMAITDRTYLTNRAVFGLPQVFKVTFIFDLNG